MLVKKEHDKIKRTIRSCFNSIDNIVFLIHFYYAYQAVTWIIHEFLDEGQNHTAKYHNLQDNKCIGATIHVRPH